MSEVCSVDDCGRPVKSRSYCNGHYRQWWAGEELRPLRRYRSTQEICPSPGMQHCTSCDQVKPEALFVFKGRGVCKACHSVAQSCRSLSITRERYKELTKNGCAICGSHDRLHIDHDHSCCPEPGKSCGQCIREALCHGCNTGLGLFKESIPSLRNAIAYLTRYERKRG